MHNSGKGAGYTKARRPVTLRWNTSCKNKSEALQLELHIKSLTRTKKLQLIEKGGDPSTHMVTGR